MLVTFTCKAWADITMFGEVATKLLKIMGHSGTVPGALLAEDVPAALDELKAAVAWDKAQSDSAPDTGESDEEAVSLANRAHPLIELLTAAAREQCDVMWHS